MAAKLKIDPVRDRQQREILDSLLSEKAAEQAEVRKQREVTLAALLGEYEPIEGHGHYWARSPKLRQQIEIARLADEQAASGDVTGAANIEGAAKMAVLAIFKEENGQTRQAAYEEILDEFTAEEIAAILAKYLGVGATEECSPNA